MGKNNQQRRRMKAKARRAANSGSRAQPADASWGAFFQESEAVSEAERLDLRINELITVAVRSRDTDRHHEFDSALAGIVQLSAARGGRREVARALGPMLRDGVTGAWRGGWQPADLHRLAGRRLAAPEQVLLGDAMAHELSRYAASTVDPRWAGQMREAEARVWWPSHQSHLECRGEDSDGAWASVVASALSVLHLLWGLPVLEVLGPLPGTAASVPTARRPGAPDVDERVLRRVRALLAKAESTTFEAEAETFTAGAQALMARHSIDAALLSVTDDRRRATPEGRRIGIDNPYEAPKALLLTAVADANRCRTVWSRELGLSTLVGFATDLDSVETLFTSLLVQATHAMTREGSRADRHGRSRTRAFRQSFLSAFAARIGERLSEVSRSETDAAAGDSGRLGGRELVPLLAARSAVVDEAVEAMFPELVMRSVALGRDLEGWHSGRRAADGAGLDRGPALEQKGGRR